MADPGYCTLDDVRRAHRKAGLPGDAVTVFDTDGGTDGWIVAGTN